MKLLPILLYLLLSIQSLCSYNHTLARRLCTLLVSTYCRPKSVKQWKCKPCQQSQIQLQNVSYIYNSTKHIFGIVGISHQPKSIILAFRGTYPWLIQNDIIDNDIRKVQYQYCDNGCKIHRGFYYAYLSIAKQIQQKIKEYIHEYNISQIIIAGHSLGATLATHAAIHLAHMGIKIQYLYVFGSYRMGDVKFTKWFEHNMRQIQYYRITQGRDPIVHMPLKAVGFNHIPHQIYYPNSKKQEYIVCNDNGEKEDQNCANNRLINMSVHDHVTYLGVQFTRIILSCI